MLCLLASGPWNPHTCPPGQLREKGVERGMVGTGWNWGVIREGGGLDGRSLCLVGLGSGIPSSGRSGENGPHTGVGRSLGRPACGR